MIGKNLQKEVVKMAIGVFLLSLVMLGIFALLGYFSYRAVLGALLGWAGCVLNYFFLAVCVEKAADKGEKGAKAYIGGTYTLRMLFIAAVIIVAIKMPLYFNYVATIIPFLFPRFVIMAFNLFKKGEKHNERTEDNI